jgi:hypothetical protein
MNSDTGKIATDELAFASVDATTDLHRQLSQAAMVPKGWMSAPVQVFGCRDGGIIHALQRPASEKRQGTKSLRSLLDPRHADVGQSRTNQALDL